MKKVLVAYFSGSGTTQKMAEYVAEGVRFSGNQAVVKSTEDIQTGQLAGYDGYLFGSPTYSLDVPEPMKQFLDDVGAVGLEGKLGGAFGPYSHDVGYSHDNHAPAIILNTLQDRFKMEPFDLGPFVLQEDILEKGEGMETCQDYGRAFGEKLGA